MMEMINPRMTEAMSLEEDILKPIQMTDYQRDMKFICPGGSSIGVKRHILAPKKHGIV